MTALANSLKRIWSARSRVPHQTGWGTNGSLPTEGNNLAGSVYETVLALTELARHSAPAVFVVVLNIFR